jgi:hypothetical protein
MKRTQGIVHVMMVVVTVGTWTVMAVRAQSTQNKLDELSARTVRAARFVLVDLGIDDMNDARQPLTAHLQLLTPESGTYAMLYVRDENGHEPVHEGEGRATRQNKNCQGRNGLCDLRRSAYADRQCRQGIHPGHER